MEAVGNSFIETFCINLKVSTCFCLLFNVDYIVHLSSYAGKASGYRERDQAIGSKRPTAACSIRLELFL